MKQILFRNRDEWREWLDKYHAIETEIWLVYYKKHCDKKSETRQRRLAAIVDRCARGLKPGM